MEAGCFYSLPKLSDADAEQSEDSIIVFQILDKVAAGKKFIKCGAPLAVSILHQPLEVYSAQPGRLDVHPVEVASVVDLLKLAAFSDLRHELWKWSSRASDVVGCIDLHSRVKAEPAYALSDERCPELLLLEQLAREGWKPSRRSKPHVLPDDPDKGFVMSSGRNQRPYYQCLLTRATLRESGLEQIHINQPLS